MNGGRNADGNTTNNKGGAYLRIQAEQPDCRADRVYRIFAGGVVVNGNDSNQTWSDIWKTFQSEDFQSELDTVIRALRSEEYGLFANQKKWQST